MGLECVMIAFIIPLITFWWTGHLVNVPTVPLSMSSIMHFLQL
jgi:hypothetical protein